MESRDENARDYVPSASGLLALIQRLPARKRSDLQILLSPDALCGFVAELPSRRWLKESY